MSKIIAILFTVFIAMIVVFFIIAYSNNQGVRSKNMYEDLDKSKKKWSR